MDISGEQQLDVIHHIMKQRLDNNGEPVAKKAVKGGCSLFLIGCIVFYILIIHLMNINFILLLKII